MGLSSGSCGAGAYGVGLYVFFVEALWVLPLRNGLRQHFVWVKDGEGVGSAFV